jgi:proteasome lid subunit RPN8/RPN11
MLIVPAAHQAEMIRHCRQGYPKEACGLLAGSREAQAEPVVVQVYPMTNTENSPVGYAMDPAEQLQVEKLMRQRGQTVLGIYHSHTASEAYPSPVDVSLAISPDVSYVLVSLKDQEQPVVKSYRIDGAKILDEEYVSR